MVWRSWCAIRSFGRIDQRLPECYTKTVRSEVVKTMRVSALSIVLALYALPGCLIDVASATEIRAAVSAVPAELCGEMVRHKTLIEGKPVSCSRLSLIRFSYFGFDNAVHPDGEMVVLDAVAHHVAAIFDSLLDRRFPIAKVRLMNTYDGDDDAADVDNNTSSFNDRVVAGTNTLSLHAYGAAIDLNPVQNPFVKMTGGKREASPAEGKPYLDRTAVKPGMAESVIDIFADNGFSIWGGDWHDPIDYQHFQLSRAHAEQLTRVSAADAKAIFEREVERYRQCRRSGKGRKECSTGT
ncbi:M15 family metallopeptidase [Bradyrhizobium sp.]|uniref:M15 family metallopeptidase n=1 Tax=Bradyrhizobium sp. TaxID=376 RepID=UPI003BB976EF